MLNNFKRYFVRCIGVMGICVAIVSCTKEDAYKQYIRNGEVKYPGKPDTVITYSGIERVQLAMLIPDPNITRIEIYWNNKANKLELPVDKSRVLTDTIKTIIDELPEATYTFEIITRDEDSNTSVLTEVQEKAYGDNYLRSLLNRGLQSAETGPDGTTTLKWYPGEETENGLELIYTSKTNTEKTIRIVKGEPETILADFKPGEQYRYRTYFRPDSNSIDVYRSVYVTMPAPSVIYADLNKALFKEYVLPTDAPSAYGWLLSYMWDGSVAEGRGLHTPVTIGSPHHFTMDLGIIAQISELRLWQRQDVYYFGYGNPRRFEIWGSANPAADGSFNGWTKLMDCESIKPSGPGAVTDQDRAYANAGEVYRLPALSQPVRYIRFKIIENWSGNSTPASGTGVHIMEVSFKGLY